MWLWRSSAAVRDVRVFVWDKTRDSERNNSTWHVQEDYFHQTLIYMCLLRHLSTNTFLFTGLDFGSRDSGAAFISVCLDTVCHQLFVLHSLCVSFFLFEWLWTHDFWMFRQFVALVCACLSPSSFFMWVSLSCLSPKRKSSVCLSCYFISSSASCACVGELEWVVMVCEPGLGLTVTF